VREFGRSRFVVVAESEPRGLSHADTNNFGYTYVVGARQMEVKPQLGGVRFR